MVAELENSLGLVLSSVAFSRVVNHALAIGWTRDPFDRLIVSDALASGSALITADKGIRKHFAGAVWDRQGVGKKGV